MEHTIQTDFSSLWTADGGNVAKTSFEGKNREQRAELRQGTRTCECPSCGLFFTGIAPFDRHLERVENGQEPPVCLSPDEMRLIGMNTNSFGVWQYGLSEKELEAANN